MAKNVTKKKPVRHRDSKGKLRRAYVKTSEGRVLVQVEEGYSDSLRTALNLEPSHAIRLAGRLLAAAERADDQAATAAAALFGQG